MAKQIHVETLRDFTGGVNFRADQFELAPNESPDLLNVDVDPRGGIEQRRGVLPLATALRNPNLLTLNEAGIETDVTPWTFINCTGSLDTITFRSGSKALKLTCTTAGVITAKLTLAVPCAPSKQHTFFAYLKSSPTNRQVTIRLDWVDAGGTFISSSVATPVTTNGLASWTNAKVTATSPANAASFVPVIDIAGCAVDELHIVDDLQVAEGSNGGMWISPATPYNAFDSPVTLISRAFESLTTAKRHTLVGTKNGGLYYLDWTDRAGGNFGVTALGGWPTHYSSSYADKLYIVSLPYSTLRWDGTAITVMGTAFNDNLTAPTNTNFPSCKYLASWQGSMWAAATHESGVSYHNRVRWSHPGSAGDWRSFDYVDIDVGADTDYIMGIVPMKDRLLIFKQRSIHAIVGTDPDNFQVYPVSMEVGAISQDCIVPTDLGVYFFSWPEGVMLYDGKNLTWEFSRLVPLIQQNLIPVDNAHKITMGWSGRRLWVSVPYRAAVTDPVPTENTRTLILDPGLTKEGSWVVYDIPAGRMTEMRLLGQESALMGCVANNNRIILLDYPGVPTNADNFGAGDVHINSYYRTRWIDQRESARDKRWRAPEFVLRSINLEDALPVQVYKDYDPSTQKSAFSLRTSEDPNQMDWGDPWGESWGPTTVSSKRSEISKGSPLGRSRSIQFVINDPTANKTWGINSISVKYQPKPVRS